VCNPRALLRNCGHPPSAAVRIDVYERELTRTDLSADCTTRGSLFRIGRSLSLLPRTLVHPNELVRARMSRSRSRRHAFLVSLRTTATHAAMHARERGSKPTRARSRIPRSTSPRYRRVLRPFAISEMTRILLALLVSTLASHPCRAGSTRRFTARSLAVGRTPRAPKGDPSGRSSHFRSRPNYPFDSRGRSRVRAHADTALFLTLLRHDGAQPPP